MFDDEDAYSCKEDDGLGRLDHGRYRRNYMEYPFQSRQHDLEQEAQALRKKMLELLLNGKSKQRMETSIKGIYIIKIPASATHPSVLELRVNLKHFGFSLLSDQLKIDNIKNLTEFIKDLDNSRISYIKQQLDHVNQHRKYY